MLAEGTVARAEKIARAAVQMLENGGEQSLLSEALTTHGIALAQLGDHDQARAVFERAIMIAEQAGDSDNAGISRRRRGKPGADAFLRKPEGIGSHVARLLGEREQGT